MLGNVKRHPSGSGWT